MSSDIRRARETARGLALDIAGPDGRLTTHDFDHVVAGTGYKVDIQRLPFIPADLASRIALTEHAPKLSSRFESTVPGLHFVGTIAAYECGPMLRFVRGAGFAARRLSDAIAAAEARARPAAVLRAPARFVPRQASLQEAQEP